MAATWLIVSPIVCESAMSNRAPVLVRILAVLALPVLLPIAAVAGLFQRPLVRTRSEVADILERYVTRGG
jgi:hypothetical protein